MDDFDIDQSEINASIQRALSAPPISSVRFFDEPVPTKTLNKNLLSIVIDRLNSAGGTIYNDTLFGYLIEKGYTKSQIKKSISSGLDSGLFTISGNNLRINNTRQGILVAEEKLTYKERRNLPDSAFAWIEIGPRGGKKRHLPVHNATHARNAMSRLSMMYNAGKLSKSKYKMIRNNVLKAYKEFGIKPKKGPVTEIKSAKLPLAAEPKARFGNTNREQDKMKKGAGKKTSKAQRAEVARANLRKAWAARGLTPTFEPKAKKRGRKAKKSTKAAEPRATRKRRVTKAKEPTRRMMPAPMVTEEPRARKRGRPRKAKTTTARSSAKRRTTNRTKAQIKEIRLKNLRKAWRARGLKPTFEPMPAFVYEPAAQRGPSGRFISQAEWESMQAPVARKRGRPKGSKNKPGSKAGRYERMVPIGTYTGGPGGQAIRITRVYGKRNPDWDTKSLAAGGVGLVLGIVGSDLLDRFVATMATSSSKDSLHGTDAIAAIRTKAGAARLATSAGGAVIGLGSAYLLREKSEIASYGLGGLGLGFLVKFLGQVVSDVLMPVIFKVDSATEVSASNRLYPDKQDYSGASATTPTTTNGNGTQAGVGRMATPRVIHLPSPQRLRMQRMPGMSGAMPNFGPVATRPAGVAGLSPSQAQRHAPSACAESACGAPFVRFQCPPGQNCSEVPPEGAINVPDNSRGGAIAVENPDGSTTVVEIPSGSNGSVSGIALAKEKPVQVNNLSDVLKTQLGTRDVAPTRKLTKAQMLNMFHNKGKLRRVA